MISSFMEQWQTQGLFGQERIRELKKRDADPQDPNSYEDSPAVEVDEYLAVHFPGEGRRHEWSP